MHGNSNPGGVKECSICYQPMTSEESKTPRLLNCGHTFCTECLQSIYITAADAYGYRSRLEREILCPHCKTPCLVPDGDVLKLPKNYALLEIMSEQPQIKTIPENTLCKTHNIVKKSYCFNCQDLVCPYCQMINHQNHNCQITIEAIKVFLPDFQQNQEQLEAYSHQLKSAKDKFQATLYRLKENQREASHHINVRFSAIIDEAQKWKNINIRKLDDITKEREDILDQQIESLNDVICETDRKVDLAKRITSPQNEEEFFIHHKNIVNETKVLVSKEMGLQPLVHEHIEWRVDPINHIIDLLNRIAFVNEDANAYPPTKSPPPSLEQPTTEISTQHARSPASLPIQRGTQPHTMPQPSVLPHPSIATHQHPHSAIHVNPSHMVMHGNSQYQVNPYGESAGFSEMVRHPSHTPAKIITGLSRLTLTQPGISPSAYNPEGPRSLSESVASEPLPPPHFVGRKNPSLVSSIPRDSSVHPTQFASAVPPEGIYSNISYHSQPHKPPDA